MSECVEQISSSFVARGIVPQESETLFWTVSLDSNDYQQLCRIRDTLQKVRCTNHDIEGITASMGSVSFCETCRPIGEDVSFISDALRSRIDDGDLNFFDADEEVRIYCDKVTVTISGVSFRAYEKYSSAVLETDLVPFTDLDAFFASSP